MKPVASFISAFLLIGTALSFAAPAFHSSVSRETQEMLQADLAFASSISGKNASPLHQEVFGKGPLSGENYTRFISERITLFRISECGGRNAVLACVNTPMDTTTLRITPSYLELGLPQLYRMGTILHEARHTERENEWWHHSSCPTPFFDGKGEMVRGKFSGVVLTGAPACDSVALGAYGIEVLFFANVAQNCSSCTEKVRMDGEIFAEDTLLRVADPGAKRKLLEDLDK